MTGLALALVLAAALLHALWNLILKRSSGGGVTFFWLMGLVETAVYAPLMLAQLLATGFRPGLPALGMMLGSAVIHVDYFLFLDRGYRAGDLSVVYPLARATGPLLTIAGAVLWLGERPSALALAGALSIGAGSLLLAGAGRHWRRSGNRRAVLFALATGATIAAYTMWDRQAVTALGIPALVYYWGTIAMRVAVTAPVALRDRSRLAALWRSERRAVLAVAVLSPLSYLLVLQAMQLAPLSYVAPARECSILIAALLGTRLLREGEAPRRLCAAAAMVAGLCGIALGG